MLAQATNYQSSSGKVEVVRRQLRVWVSLGTRLVGAAAYAFVAMRGLRHGGFLGILFAAFAVPLCLYMLSVAGVVGYALWRNDDPL